jgi:hypothetical protein
METIIVAAIIGLALIYVGRTFYRQFRGKGGCSSGCSACTPEAKHYCSDTPQSIPKP